MISRLGKHVRESAYSGVIDDPRRTSTDGRILLALLALILVGPYLPILAAVRVVGVDVSDALTGARLDNIALPLVAVYFFARSLRRKSLNLPPLILWYIAFLVWIALITVYWWVNLPEQYSEGNARGIGLLRSIDAYGRPATILFIAANVRITRHDFKMLIRLVLGVGVLLGFIAAAQLHEATFVPVNRFLFDYYDNSFGNYFWGVVNQGRAAALMPQLSTLGMYIVLAFGLLAAQLLGGRSISSPWLFGVVVGGVFLGGMMSGSKVFVGGTGLLGIGLLLTLGGLRKDSIPKIIAAIVAIGIVWTVALDTYPDQAKRMVAWAGLNRAPGINLSKDFNVPVPDVDDITTGGSGGLGEEKSVSDSRSWPLYDRFLKRYYDSYLESRFNSATGKVFRTGAIDIAQEYPVTGLGLNVVNRTTDSMALGIFIMGGAIGSFIYLAMLATMAIGLMKVSRRKTDPEAAATARVLLILTVVFLITSVAFHTFIQDRAGDAYWLLVGLVLGPMGVRSATRPILEVASDPVGTPDPALASD